MLMGRPPRCACRAPVRRRGWRWTPVLGLTLVALLVTPGRAPAQSTPSEAAPLTWIRPEEVPTRADALLRQLESAQPDAAAESSLEEIERSLPQLDRDLDPVLARVTDAVARSAALAELEDLRRELTSIATPLADWKDELAAEAKRVAEVLDEIARDKRVWSETRSRPETAAAGDVVVRRVERSPEALNEAAARLDTWRGRVLAANDRVIDRVAAADTALEKLRVETAAERVSLFVPDRAPLWSSDLGSEIQSELPRVPEQILAYARSTSEYIDRDPRALVVQALLD